MIPEFFPRVLATPDDDSTLFGIQISPLYAAYLPSPHARMNCEIYDVLNQCAGKQCVIDCYYDDTALA